MIVDAPRDVLRGLVRRRRDRHDARRGGATDPIRRLRTRGGYDRRGFDKTGLHKSGGWYDDDGIDHRGRDEFGLDAAGREAFDQVMRQPPRDDDAPFDPPRLGDTNV